VQIVPATESIFYIKEMLSEELCQTIITNYERDTSRHAGYVIRGGGEKELQNEIKVSTDLVIPQGGAWAAAFDEVNQGVNSALQQITAQIPSLQIWPLWWTGYKIQHYKKNEGHFKWHFDAIGPGTWERQLAMVIYLNSVQDGGETCFHRQNLQIKPIVGDALIFPTFWTHAHCGQIPRSEDKYIISSFVSFSIPAAQKDGRALTAEAG
jgi:2-oxoglutarate-Fe(II)-dependent oxygenase superfamily protein